MYKEFFDDFDGLEQTLSLSAQTLIPAFDLDLYGSKNIDKLIKDLLDSLERFFPIHKASLAFYDPRNACLRVTHIHEVGKSKTGLRLTIPCTDSMLYQVLTQGYPVADNYPELITGNVIEKKILLTAGARSVLIVPLIYNGAKMALLNLASRDEYAFGLYMEGIGEGVVLNFIDKLNEALKTAKSTI